MKPEFNYEKVKQEIPKKSYPSKKTKKISIKDLFAKESEIILKERGYSILEILKSDKDKFIVKIFKDKELLGVIYNKKRIDETVLFRDLKKFVDFGLNFEIFLKQELSKKTLERIDLSKKIANIVKISEQ